MKTLACFDGSPLPLPKQTIRECSRNRPMMLLTLMFPTARHAGPEAADAADHEVDGHPAWLAW
jgi:hypothetical protein